MTELCLSTMSKAQLVFILVFSDLYIFSSFILSHPLYLSYFLFFSPYLLKLLSFLSPLFLTTSLLLFSLFANFISHEYSCWRNWEFPSQNNMGFLTGAYHAMVHFRSKLSTYHNIADDDQMEYIRFEDSDVFKIVFDIPMLINNDDDDAMTTQVEHEEIFFQALEEDASSSSSEFSDFTCCLKESNECESGFSCSTAEELEIQQPIGTKDKKVAEELSLVRNGSEAESNKVGQDYYSKNYYMGPTLPATCPSSEVKQECNKEFQDAKSSHHSDSNDDDYINGEMKVESSRTLNYNLGSYGSMRKQEREWKRTLACKLFEERHNVVGSGGEGMDMLWETYEVESSKNKINPKSRNKNLQKKYHQLKAHDNGEDEEELEEDDESNGQLCCLQALKFSAGKKMNLGMRKPNLVKITKAIKGLGWLHHQVTSSSRRSSKKVHNGE